MSKYLTPEWKTKVFISDGTRTLDTNMFVVEKYKYLDKGFFVCDLDGNPLDAESINKVIETSEPVVIETPEQPEIETPVEPEIEVKPEPVIETKKSEVPDDLVCPHCEAKARNEKSYKKNHGDNCHLKL